MNKNNFYNQGTRSVDSARATRVHSFCPAPGLVSIFEGSG